MHPVFAVISVYFALGMLGTALANRHKPPDVRRQRWLKIVVHVAIVYALAGLLTCAPAYLRWAALLLTAIGLWELAKVREEGRSAGHMQPGGFYLATFLVYGFVGLGFYGMAAQFESACLLRIFLLVFTFDGFSQIAGQLAGRRKLFPGTSPNKTQEGLLGGFFMAMLTGILLLRDASGDTLDAMRFSLIVVAGALAGDWLASWYKRRHGVKDYSALIPGHGGVLDRFDSWITAGALVWWVGYMTGA